MPSTRREPVADVLHGQKVPDPYRWIEDADKEEVKDWMKAQDRLTRLALGRIPGRQALHRRLAEVSYFDFSSAPLRRGDRYFFTRQFKDKEKPVHYWQRGEKGTPQVLLDPNQLSPDGSIALREVTPSWDGKWVAYKLSQNNADAATLHLMEVESGKRSEVDTIDGAKYAAPSWTPDGDGFYYTRLPTDPSIPLAELPGRAEVRFHRLGTSPEGDALIHPATGDSSTFISAILSRDGRFLFLYKQHGWTSTDLYFQELKRKKGRKDEKGPRDVGEFSPLRVGQTALYNAVAWQGQIYLLTNEGAPRYALFQVDPSNPARDRWRTLVAEQPEAVLDDFDIRGGHLALRYLHRAASYLEVATLDGKPVHRVPLPSAGTVSSLTGNPEDDTAYFTFTSFLTPTSVFRVSIKTNETKLHFQPDLPVDTTPFGIEQVSYPSRDGTMISMFIVGPREMEKQGETPFILTGYGGFNVSLTPLFTGSRMVWLEQGGAIAIPNLRGGGEYGEQWHRAGMLLNKQNVFDDFLAAAEHLVAQGYTSPERLAIVGGSNGGLLVGAAMVQRPALFAAVSCHVPLLDMVRYHLFGSGKTWISEYGSADDPHQFAALMAYSPYHHVQEGTAYPALLMMSADSDDRVDPMHARKFTAAVQHASRSGKPVLFRLETASGHGGADMIKKQIEATTDEFLFLKQQLGMVR